MTTTFAPSLVYAPGDAWLTMLERLALLPVMPFSGNGRALFQPIWADDVASCVLSLVLLSSYALLQNDATLSRSTLGISVAETRAQAMLHGLERELADARGANPIAPAKAAMIATRIRISSSRPVLEATEPVRRPRRGP